MWQPLGLGKGEIVSAEHLTKSAKSIYKELGFRSTTHFSNQLEVIFYERITGKTYSSSPSRVHPAKNLPSWEQAKARYYFPDAQTEQQFEILYRKWYEITKGELQPLHLRSVTGVMPQKWPRGLSEKLKQENRVRKEESLEAALKWLEQQPSPPAAAAQH